MTITDWTTKTQTLLAGLRNCYQQFQDLTRELGNVDAADPQEAFDSLRSFLAQHGAADPLAVDYAAGTLTASLAQSKAIQDAYRKLLTTAHEAVEASWLAGAHAEDLVHVADFGPGGTRFHAGVAAGLAPHLSGEVEALGPDHPARRWLPPEDLHQLFTAPGQTGSSAPRPVLVLSRVKGQRLFHRDQVCKLTRLFSRERMEREHVDALGRANDKKVKEYARGSQIVRVRDLELALFGQQQPQPQGEPQLVEGFQP